MGLCDPQNGPFPVFARISRVRNLTIGPKISPIVRLPAIQLCGKFEGSGTFESRDMGLCDPENDPFPVFAKISRVRNLTIGPKFHRLSISRPYSCVECLKEVGHSSLEIWAFVTPKMAPFLWPLSCVCKDISSSELYNWPKISPIVRLPAIQLCGKFEGSGTFESRDMGLCDPQNGPFPVFARISRVRNLTIGPNFWGSQRPISRDSNVELSSNFSPILNIRTRDILANTGNPIQRGNFGGHKGLYLETRMSNFLSTFYTVVWPVDG